MAEIPDAEADTHEIVRAWESFSGWYWLGTDEPDDDGRMFGLVLGQANEWGYFSIPELEEIAQVWEVTPPGAVDVERGRFKVRGGTITETPREVSQP